MRGFNKGWKVFLRCSGSSFKEVLVVELGYEIPWLPRQGEAVKYNDFILHVEWVEWYFDEREIIIVVTENVNKVPHG